MSKKIIFIVVFLFCIVGCNQATNRNYYEYNIISITTDGMLSDDMGVDYIYTVFIKNIDGVTFKYKIPHWNAVILQSNSKESTLLMHKHPLNRPRYRLFLSEDYLSAVLSQIKWVDAKFKR